MHAILLIVWVAFVLSGLAAVLVLLMLLAAEERAMSGGRPPHEWLDYDEWEA